MRIEITSKHTKDRLTVFQHADDDTQLGVNVAGPRGGNRGFIVLTAQQTEYLLGALAQLHHELSESKK